MNETENDVGFTCHGTLQTRINLKNCNKPIKNFETKCIEFADLAELGEISPI